LKKLNVGIVGLGTVGGIVGLGTVGGGTYTVLTRNADEISRRIGVDVNVAQVADKDLGRANNLTNSTTTITDDAFALASSPDVDVVVELIGGYTIAKDVVLKAIEHGKHVVTANKALIALHGNEIFAAAKKAGVMVAYEAAVAGGIPIIKALREGLTANRHQWVAGILNGTTNYILTEMRDKGLAYQDVIGEAQRLGYAEADPTFDVEGIDAAHKLVIMSAIAFGMPLKFDEAYTEGITKIAQADIQYAQELGYSMKLLGITKRADKGVELRVHPTLIPAQQLVASVDGAMNAVAVQSDAVGSTLYYGAGAGAEPTASAVVADLVDVARLMDADEDERPAALGYQVNQVQDIAVLPIEEIESAYYLRMSTADQSAAIAEVKKVLEDYSISIEQVVQKAASDVVVLTGVTVEKDMDAAIAALEALPTINGTLVKLRMEALG